MILKFPHTRRVKPIYVLLGAKPLGVQLTWAGRIDFSNKNWKDLDYHVIYIYQINTKVMYKSYHIISFKQFHSELIQLIMEGYSVVFQSKKIERYYHEFKRSEMEEEYEEETNG